MRFVFSCTKVRRCILHDLHKNVTQHFCHKTVNSDYKGRVAEQSKWDHSESSNLANYGATPTVTFCDKKARFIGSSNYLSHLRQKKLTFEGV